MGPAYVEQPWFSCPCLSGRTTMLAVIHGHEREPSQCLDKALFLGEGGGRGRGSLLLDKMLATL